MENEAIHKQIRWIKKKEVSDLYASMHKPVAGHRKTEYFIILFPLKHQVIS